jgi:hypothetical protein
VQVSFQCEDQTVAGALAVRVDRAGRFEQRTKRLVTLADVGSDTDVTIRGRLTDRAAEGTIDAHARAFYNAGTTFECTKDRIKWRAASTDDPGAERVERFLPARADALAVTENAVFVDEEQGDKASTVKRLDPHSGKAKWTPGRRRRSRRGKRGAVWIVSGATGRVIGLDARSGRVAATTVGPGRFDAIAPGTPQPIAVAPDSVWVATAAGLVRLGPTTGHEKARVPGGCSRDVVAGPTSIVTAVAVPGPDGRPVASRIVLVDPATNQVVAAGSGTLASTPDGLVALNASGAVVARVRGITGELAAGRDTVWVLDPGADGLVRVRAG